MDYHLSLRLNPMEPVPQQTSTRVQLKLSWTSSDTALYKTSAALVLMAKNDLGEIWNFFPNSSSVSISSPIRFSVVPDSHCRYGQCQVLK